MSAKSLGDNRVYALESNSYGGKSTYLDVVEKRGFYVVHEPSHYVVQFPYYPFRSQSEAEANIDFFLEVEMRRSDDISKRGDLNAVMDRCLLTYIYFQLLVSKYDQNVPNAYEYAIDTYCKAISNDRVFFPDRMIIMNVHNEEEYRRRLARRGLVKETNLLANWGAYTTTYQWLLHFVNNLGEDFGAVLNSPWQPGKVLSPNELFKNSGWSYSKERLIEALQSMKLCKVI